MRKPKHGELFVVEIECGDRPLVAVAIKSGKSVILRILERDPVFYGARMRLTEAYSVRRCAAGDSAELIAQWGVSVFDEAARCPECGTPNLLRRMDTGQCLICVMKRCHPFVIPKLKIKAKPKRKPGRPRKRKIAA